MKRMMKKLSAVIMATVIGVVSAGCGTTPLPDDVVASVNGTDITDAYYQKTIKKVAEDNGFEQLYGEDIWDKEIEEGVTFRKKFSEQILDLIIMQELIYQDASTKNLKATDEEVDKEYNSYMDIIKKDPEYSAFVEKNGMDEAFLKDSIAKSLNYKKYTDAVMDEIKPTDEEIKKYYDENLKKEFTNNEVKASHILISTLDVDRQPLSEDKKAEKLKLAESILARAKGGEDFAKLAKEYSEDSVSAVQGGDLGYFSPGMMVQEFNDKAFSMKVGEISDIVETQFGYHIIYLTDKKDNVITLDEAKTTIIAQIKNQKLGERLQELRSKSKVIINQALENK